MKSVLAFIAGVTLVVGGFFAYNQLQTEGSGGGVALWYINSSYIQPASTSWGLKIPSLANCDTIDTNGSGQFACGTDSTGSGATSNWLFNGSRLTPSTTVGIGVFSSSTITDLSSTYATTTNAIISTSLKIFGTLATALSDLCVGITGGAGLCDGTDADTTYTAGDALTLTGTDIDFDGGATPAGDLGNTWADPSVDNDSHDHTTLTVSGLDISDDTNLSADGTEIVLTGDALSLGTALTFTNGTSSTSFQTALLGVGTDYISDITGTGIVNTAGALQASLGTSITASEMADGDHGFFTYASNVASVDSGAWTSANLASYLTNETGTGNAVFSETPLFTGTIQGSGLYLTTSSTLAYASTTALTNSGNAILGNATATSMYSTTASSTSLFASVVNFGTSLLKIVGNTLTGLGVWDLGGADSFEGPNNATCTVDATGEQCVDTTFGQFKYFDGSATQVLTGTTTKCFNVASTTKDATGNSFNTATATLVMGFDAEQQTLIGWYAQATTSGSVSVRFGDGTNWTNDARASTGAFTPATSNNTFTQYEQMIVQIGSQASTPSRVTVCAAMSKTSQ